VVTQTVQFTVTGDDRAEQRIRRDMDRIKDKITESFPSFLCLALIGAFGRGEGAVVFKEERLEPWNDYDLVLVTATRNRWDELPALAKALSSQLGIRGIDIVPFLPDELERKASAMLVADARDGHVVIAGDQEILTRIPRRPIPDREALILLLNRMVCLLEAPPESLTGSPPDPLFYASQLSKAIFAVVDAHLVRAGRYVTSYREKTKRFLDLTRAGSKLKEAAAEALSFRLSPSARSWGASRWFLARDVMVEQISHLLGNKPGSPALTVAKALWGRRYPGYRGLVRLLVRGQRPQIGCTAVQCAELLTLAAASPYGQSNTVLLGEAVRFMSKADPNLAPQQWADAAHHAVNLWFRVCHG
jgi:hypothetical protein